MTVYNTSPFGNDDIAQLVGIKTNVGGFFFDAVLRLDHVRKATITKHPVEDGANISDHAFMEPMTLSMEIGMSDVCASFINGQFAQNSSRSVSAFDVLERLQNEFRPLTVQTRLKTYRNMLIETITAPDDFMTMNGLRVSVGFTEVKTVKTATVAMPNRTSADPHKTGETNRGTVQPVEDSRSTIRKGLDWVIGW
jgi:hypothetical protein